MWWKTGTEGGTGTVSVPLKGSWRKRRRRRLRRKSGDGGGWRSESQAWKAVARIRHQHQMMILLQLKDNCWSLRVESWMIQGRRGCLRHGYQRRFREEPPRWQH